MHADRTNRTVLILLGLLLLGAGTGALLLSTGVFGRTLEDGSLFDNATSRYIGAHGSWIWAAAAVVSVLVSFLVLRWLAALLLTTDRADDIMLGGDHARGATTIRPGAISSALDTELQSYRGVESSKTRLVGDAASPTLVVTVTAARNAGLAQLRSRIESEALAHARTVLDDPQLPIQLDLVPSRATSARVR